MPSKVNNRRTISVRKETYDKLRNYCASTNRSKSDLIEQLVKTFFDDVELQNKVVAHDFNEVPSASSTDVQKETPVPKPEPVPQGRPSGERLKVLKEDATVPGRDGFAKF